ncbi:MalY/PatB family protein [Falsirhodobacter halotolerans]|uniref:MalY/PatB family protein n=1 Tax=Falsirhodobacter halotolerans TaxID=1146892 RepID=UPI001FD232B5|nr:MalY/PatB family protein [Falsirhodobacter halotolerans]MCJ8138469.1 pyridoxal phosphate-dependent aminotransferase [Falsirhodobacter halotolerans]
MNFDEAIDRIGTHSVKWDMMETLYDVPKGQGLPMWVADMDFRPPAAVQAEVEAMAAHGVYGYFGDDRPYLEAIRWWMRTRHGWEVDADAIFTTHGLVNGTGLCIDAFTQPGDGVVLMTPVYHAFARVIKTAGRKVVSCPLAQVDGRYVMDIDAWDAQMTGAERMLILCSPHNPGGRVWTAEELRAVADFCVRHDLILVSDEIHHDLVFPGQRHVPMPLAAPDIVDRLVMMTATTKTFNIAGSHTGNVIIPDPTLRARFAGRLAALGISPNSFGLRMATAAYSPEGAAWLDELMAYLDENRRMFDAAVNAIPGVRSMPLEATYLSWVDFSGTGMTQDEILTRVEKQGGIAASHGITFGEGGEHFLRFNIATTRANIENAAQRLRDAFADLQ